jgi:hypothetical protein
MERNNKNKGPNQQNRDQNTIQRINETKSLYFEKLNGIGK